MPYFQVSSDIAQATESVQRISLDSMRVVVDSDTCAVTGGCVFHAPQVFRLGDDGMLHVLQEFPNESLRTAVQKAADYCPTGAISIED